jgi:hypothetical protein
MSKLDTITEVNDVKTTNEININDYDLTEQLGEGSFGTVQLCVITYYFI